ncbi:hypothetical protein ACFY9A_40170, partial [Streptomyces rubradiris]|uniref:hypothetical protein n=1 Tax=Streptomyces rubradiris TaxID=285531 RepID=UPI0036E15837
MRRRTAKENGVHRVRAINTESGLDTEHERLDDRGADPVVGDDGDEDANGGRGDAVDPCLGF